MSNCSPTENQSRAMSWTTSCCSLLIVGVVNSGSVGVVLKGSLDVGRGSESALEGLERGGTSDVFTAG